jgi:hypothetical protein
MPMHDSPRDQILHAMAREGWANESDGNVESLTGWFCRISNSADDIVSLVDAFGETAFGIAPAFDFSELIGHFVLSENSDGNIYVSEWPSEHIARLSFNELSSQFAYWNNADSPVEDY